MSTAPSFFSRVCKCCISTSRDKGSAGTLTLIQFLDSPPCLGSRRGKNGTATPFYWMLHDATVLEGPWYPLILGWGVNSCQCLSTLISYRIADCKPSTWMQDHLAASPVSEVSEPNVGWCHSRWCCKQWPMKSPEAQILGKIHLVICLA